MTGRAPVSEPPQMGPTEGRGLGTSHRPLDFHSQVSAHLTTGTVSVYTASKAPSVKRTYKHRFRHLWGQLYESHQTGWIQEPTQSSLMFKSKFDRLKELNIKSSGSRVRYTWTQILSHPFTIWGI